MAFRWWADSVLLLYAGWEETFLIRDTAKQTYLKDGLRYPHRALDHSKTCLKRPLKIDKIKVLMKNGSFMKVESFAECFPLNILQYV